ncbi:Sec7 domain containing protein, partial [Entamoeba invadens IP1]
LVMEQNALSNNISDLSKHLPRQFSSSLQSLKSILSTTKPHTDKVQKALQVLLPQIAATQPLKPGLVSSLLPILDPLFLSSKTFKTFLKTFLETFVPNNTPVLLLSTKIVFQSSKFQLDNVSHIKVLSYLIDSVVISSFSPNLLSQCDPKSVLTDYVKAFIRNYGSQTNSNVSPVIFPPSPSPLISPAFGVTITRPVPLTLSTHTFMRNCNTPGVSNTSSYVKRSLSSMSPEEDASDEKESVHQSKVQAILTQLLVTATTPWADLNSQLEKAKRTILKLDQKSLKTDITCKEVAIEMINIVLFNCKPNALTTHIKEALVKMFKTSALCNLRIAELCSDMLGILLTRHGSHFKNECRQIVYGIVTEFSNQNKLAASALLRLTHSRDTLKAIYLLYDKDSLGSAVFRTIVATFSANVGVSSLICEEGLKRCIETFSKTVETYTLIEESKHPNYYIGPIKKAVELCPSSKPIVIANYLLKDKTLESTAVGFYLTNNEEVLSEYIKLNETSNGIYKTILDILSRFKLPNDSYSFDVFVKVLTEIFTTNNTKISNTKGDVGGTNISTSTTESFIRLSLLFSLDQCDRPVVADFNDFVRRADNNGIDHIETLMQLYDSIVEEPFTKMTLPQISDDDVDMFQSCFSSLLSGLQVLYTIQVDVFQEMTSLLVFSMFSHATNELQTLLEILCEWSQNGGVPKFQRRKAALLVLQFAYTFGDYLEVVWRLPLTLFCRMLDGNTTNVQTIPTHFRTLRYNKYIQTHPHYTANTNTVLSTNVVCVECPNEILLQEIFKGTGLSPRGFVEFIKRYCEVIQDELNHERLPQKTMNYIIVLLNCNKHKLFYVYDQIGSFLFEMFTSFALQYNGQVAKIAVEVLNSYFLILN